jgi:hypothetical protein
MNTIRFINTRQQACAAVLALSLTLGMLSMREPAGHTAHA